MSNVNDLIARLRPGIPPKLDTEALPSILSGIFWTVFRSDEEWAKRLVSDFCDSRAWIKLIRESEELSQCVEKCTKSGDWAPLFDLNFLRVQESDQQDKSPPKLLWKGFKTAFEMEYQAPYPGILLSTIDSYYPTGLREKNYYTRSFAIIQSSGMGKSRMMDHCATLRFTIPFNIHEKTGPGLSTYPPIDNHVRDFITQEFSRELYGITRPLVFLQALFTETIAQLRSYTEGTPQEIAHQWYNWMDQGSAADVVGENRNAFYQRVLNQARNLEGQAYQGSSVDILTSRKQELRDAARSLVNRLRELDTDNEGPKFSAIVYFDNAHTLLSAAGDQQLDDLAPYSTLMHVLSVITEIPIFFVFLSANPDLNVTFGPTDTENFYPSALVQLSSKVIPPFFELPFDAFSRNFDLETRANKKLTLSGVCELEQMSKFGRPLWYSFYRSSLEKGDADVIKLAITKLKGGGHSQLAALDSRVLIEFDSRRALSLETELVKSHMRCVFNIPEGGQCLYSGYPSEPMLSEAAGHILNESIIDKAPEILNDALQMGLLVMKKRGELVARTLLTVAHDLAASEETIDTMVGPQYHRPIKLISLLEKLLAPVIWEKVRHATPEEASDGDPELEEAFKDTWVNFSHFIRLGNSHSYNRTCAFALLMRGAAMQMYDNQEDLDFAIPLYTGGPTSEISPNQTSIAQFQVKNTSHPPTTQPDPRLIGDEVKLPILSIVMQLGKEQQADRRVRIRTTAEISGPAGHTCSAAESQHTDVTHRHYSIELFGCTSDTYACVGENGQKYQNVLRTETKPFSDYPRENSKEFLEAVYTLKPVLYSHNLASLDWVD